MVIDFDIDAEFIEKLRLTTPSVNVFKAGWQYLAGSAFEDTVGLIVEAGHAPDIAITRFKFVRVLHDLYLPHVQYSTAEYNGYKYNEIVFCSPFTFSIALIPSKDVDGGYVYLLDSKAVGQPESQAILSEVMV